MTRIGIWRGSVALVATLLAVAPTAAQAQGREDKALRRPASASSVQVVSALAPSQTCIPCTPGKANDGDPDTRWGSTFDDPRPAWQVDLGAARLVDAVVLDWEDSYATRYQIETSLDGSAFTVVAREQIGLPGTRRTTFAPTTARHVRVTGLAKSNAGKGISLWSAQVFGPPDPTAPAPSSSVTATGPTAAGTAAGPAVPGSSSSIRLPDTGAPARSSRALLLSPFPIVRIRGSVTATGARIALLSVRAPRGTTIDVRCRGRGCSARRLTLRSRRLTRVRALERHFRAGTVIEVLVARRGRVGKYTRFRVRRGRAPARADGCASFEPRRRTPC